MAHLDYPSWLTLKDHAANVAPFSISKMFDDDKHRAEKFSLEAAGIYLDYSKNLITEESLKLFSAVCSEANLPKSISDMFSGEKINVTENRAALHTLLRSQQEQAPPQLKAEAKAIANALKKIESISKGIQNGEWRGCSGKKIVNVIHLGIGGSNLGPFMVDEALAPYRGKQFKDIQSHYIANIDGHHIKQTLEKIDPTETLIIIASKSFSTLETLANANTAKKWLLTYMDDAALEKHVIAITSNHEAAREFGVATDKILPMWDWVGGRYSLWSAVGLPIAIRYGFEVFSQLLEGAREMDKHFAESKMEENMPMILACLGIWYQHFFDANSHAVIPYDHGLRFLPAHLQQLDMESNGKSVRLDNETVDYPTGAIIWGGEGSNGQHAFHQLLHQGNRFVGLDFILPLKAHHDLQEHHDQLVANCFSQSQALLVGREMSSNSEFTKHKSMPGNRPSNTILMDQLTPQTLGALVALYEHKVFCQAVIWKINPFDQWGVELGKELSEAIYHQIKADNNTKRDHGNLDPSTSALISRYLDRT
ncbi:MAG: glucose-6-phosphate isomerase [Pseudomonadales bacterium]|nr:glucose-6-phosphate isomerase [Pseudomonadales bacterium]